MVSMDAMFSKQGQISPVQRLFFTTKMTLLLPVHHPLLLESTNFQQESLRSLNEVVNLLKY